MRHLSSASLIAVVAFLGACSDSSAPPATMVGNLAAINIRSGNNQSALAGTAVPTAVIVVPVDDQNQTVPNQTGTFSVIAGGGTIANTTGTANSDGSITAPTWTLGKSVVPQQLQLTIGSKTTVIAATVTTSYKIDVRFFGRTLTPVQAALFTNAAARVRAIVVGQLPLVDATGADPSVCGVTGVAPLSETIDGVVIYASIDSIDGPGKILAQSGPCYIRTTSSGGQDFRTSIGVMQFDSADINSLATTGNLQQVITHEMLHVVGFGSFWRDDNLLINDSTSAVAYIGAGGIAGCKSLGAAVTCANSVPVEGTSGGAGTLYTHWSEQTFYNELMTGFLNSGANPLSVMTIRSLADLNYTVNPAAADPYTLPVGTNLRASFRFDDITATPTPGVWERPLPHTPRALPTVGATQNLRGHR